MLYSLFTGLCHNSVISIITEIHHAVYSVSVATFVRSKMKKMKIKLFTLIALAFATSGTFAQVTITDSVSMLPSTVVDVFYNLETGKKDTVRNNNWHLAFAMRHAQPPLKTMQAATVLINEGRGVSLYSSNQTLTNWSSFDTTNWMSWPSNFNSDSTLEVGAFNQGRNVSNPFDYGWGQYNTTSRDVAGNKIYLLAIDGPYPGAPSSGFRKICIQKIAYDTQWVFTISKLDGTDSNTVTINKNQFNGKLFAYYNMNTNTVIDREPIPYSQWNLLFTRYKTLVTLGPQTVMYPVMGVLQNPNTMAYKVAGATANAATYDTTLFNGKSRGIDWDWKEITTTPGEWPVKDSLVYFTRVDNKINKIKFTKYYAASDRQIIIFNKTSYAGLSVNENVYNTVTASVYPNPATTELNIELSNAKQANVTISNLSGKTIATGNFINAGKVDVSGLQTGMYLLNIATENGSQTIKFIKQ